MASNNSLYDGIISPQGGLYKPTPATNVYNGIYPSNSSLTTRKVNTVPINPVTGNPVSSASSGPTQAQMQAIRDMSYFGGDLPRSYAPGASSSMGSLNPALAYAGSPGANQGTGTAMAPGNQAITQALMGSSAKWGQPLFPSFLGGDPGQTDWSKVNPDGIGPLGNTIDSSAYPPNPPPNAPPAAPTGLAALFNNSPIGKGLALLKSIPGKSAPTTYQTSPAGTNPAVHAQLMAQQAPRSVQAAAGVFGAEDKHRKQNGGSIGAGGYQRK